MFKDYYKILEISQNATEKEIKKAFREQAIKWHPDKNPGKDTTLKMQEINEAYLILKDKEARLRYDIEYNKFKQYQKQTKKEERKEEKTQYHSENQNSYEYKEYKVEDDILAKWMQNAKRQAVDLAKQTIEDFKGVSKAAADGCLNGIIQSIIWIVVMTFIFAFIRSCNN